MERKFRKGRKGWDEQSLLWIECPDTKLALGTPDTLHSPRDVDGVEHREISVSLVFWDLKGQVFRMIS